eukprot:1722072-Rhodomonas_salina.2
MLPLHRIQGETLMSNARRSDSKVWYPGYPGTRVGSRSDTIDGHFSGCSITISKLALPGRV